MAEAIPGLRYVADYLEQPDHERLLGTVDRHAWQTSDGRGVQVYGHRYHHPTHSTYPIGDLPDWAVELGERLRRDGLLPAVPDQLVVNGYPPGSGIRAHIDHAVLGATIASVSLGSTCVMQFSDEQSDRRAELFLEPRSVLVLSGEARAAWRHEIPARRVDVWCGVRRRRSRRVSLTFRIMPRD